jgi:hypothetical protein
MHRYIRRMKRNVGPRSMNTMLANLIRQLASRMKVWKTAEPIYNGMNTYNSMKWRKMDEDMQLP